MKPAVGRGKRRLVRDGFCVGKVFLSGRSRQNSCVITYVIQQNHLGKNKAWICELVGFTILRHPAIQGLCGGCALD